MNQERLSKDEQERARILRIEAEQRRLKKAEEENKEGGNDKRYGSFEAELMTLSCLVMTARGQKLLKQEEKP